MTQAALASLVGLWLRAVVLACVTCSSACAQAIGQYFNDAVPGYDSSEGVTVASRRHPEYDAAGIRLGPILLTPSVSQGIGYDDNVTGTRDGQGSLLSETAASLGAANLSLDTRVVAQATLDQLIYPEQRREDSLDWTAALGVSHDLGQDMVEIGATHLNLDQTSRDLALPELDRSTPFRVDDLRTVYTANLGVSVLQPGLDVSYYSFDNGSVRGRTYLQSYRDRLVIAPSLTYAYEFATRRKLLVVLQDDVADFDSALPGQPRQNFDDVSALVGIAYQYSGFLDFRLLGGYERRSFASRLYATIQSPVVQGKAIWTPTNLTTVTGSAARTIEDPAAEGTVGVTETAIKLDLDHEYLRNVVISLRAAATIDDYQRSAINPSVTQTLFSAGCGATWLLDRHLRLAADYLHTARSTGGRTLYTLPAAEGLSSQNYADDVLRLTLRLAL